MSRHIVSERVVWAELEAQAARSFHALTDRVLEPVIECRMCRTCHPGRQFAGVPCSKGRGITDCTCHEVAYR